MVEFVVRVPEDTPPDASVYLSGDIDPLGRWKPDAIPLEPWGDGTHRVRLNLPRGIQARYHITRGRWRTVEGSNSGREIPARTLINHRLLTVSVNVAGWGREAVRYHPEFPSSLLTHTRPLIVALPPGYDLHPDRRYPVFYLHDGQNLFDDAAAFGGTAWGCDETADRLARTGEIEPVILVGVGNSPARLDEYGPRRTGRRRGPDIARAYGRFLVEDVKPFIDSNYRTLTGPADTAVGGSSMGGLMALYVCRWHPAVFGKCAALSPSLWWDREYFLRSVADHPSRGVRLWLDMGGREGSTPAGMRANVRRATRLAAVLGELGCDYRFEAFPGAEHTEAAWGARFDRVVSFLFGRAL